MPTEAILFVSGLEPEELGEVVELDRDPLEGLALGHDPAYRGEQGLVAFLPLDGLVDAAKERARLGKQQAKLAADAEKLAARLGSAGFADKAPAAVVDKAKQELADLHEQLAQIDKSLAELPPE